MYRVSPYVIATLVVLDVGPVRGQQEMVVDSGLVVRVETGMLYLSGFPHALVLVASGLGDIYLAAPNVGVPQSFAPGELLVFSGRMAVVSGRVVIDPREGFVYRPEQLTTEEYMAKLQEEQMMEMAAAIEEAGDDPSTSSIPVTMLQTEEQQRYLEQDEANAKRQRRTDLLLTIMSIILGIVALDRIPRAMRLPWEWAKRWSHRRRAANDASITPP